MFRIARTETAGLFEKAVEYVLAELDQMRQKPASLYLVDGQTGRAVLPIGPESVYRPPDFVGEDGKVHKARPVVHPGISSSLALARAKAGRTEALAARAASDPSVRRALDHVLNPDCILTAAAERLRELGVEVGGVGHGRESEIRIGHEHVAEAQQSLNPRFHRAALLAEVLARRVLAASRGAMVELLSIRQEDNNKKRWHSVRIRVETPRLLAP
jgi:hypothetical protein